MKMDAIPTNFSDIELFIIRILTCHFISAFSINRIDWYIIIAKVYYRALQKPKRENLIAAQKIFCRIWNLQRDSATLCIKLFSYEIIQYHYRIHALYVCICVCAYACVCLCLYSNLIICTQISKSYTWFCIFLTIQCIAKVPKISDADRRSKASEAILLAESLKSSRSGSSH